VTIDDAGLTIAVNGGGEAGGRDVHDAFSRHDTDATVVFDLEQDARLRFDWFHYASGLGTVWLRLHRSGDAGGGGVASPYLIDRSISSYIDFIFEDGVDVLHLPAGRWLVRAMSTQLAMDSGEPGFQHSFARTTHTGTWLALGDADGDGAVDVTDLLTLIESWGACSGSCQADLNSDGIVDVEDMLTVLADWTQ